MYSMCIPLSLYNLCAILSKLHICLNEFRRSRLRVRDESVRVTCLLLVMSNSRTINDSLF